MGFTRKELAVLVFLAVTFLSGLGVWVYRAKFAPLPESGPFLDIEEDSSEGSREQPFLGETSKQEPADDALSGEPDLVDLNRSPKHLIETLPGVGPVIAGRILAYRFEHGHFKTIDELLEVKGIGHKTLDHIRPYIKPIIEP